MYMWISWLILIILLAVLEAITINLVSIWFIASGLVSLFLSFFVDSFSIQFAIFVILGLILMLVTRPVLVKKFGRTMMADFGFKKKYKKISHGIPAMRYFFHFPLSSELSKRNASGSSGRTISSSRSSGSSSSSSGVSKSGPYPSS